MSDERKPLYSDNYIVELIDRRVKAYGGNAKVGARSVAHEIRNTYEHRISQLEAALAELRQPQAAEWEPVEDGDINSWVSVEDNGRHIAVYVNDDRYAEETLPEGYAVCRRRLMRPRTE